MIRGDLVIRTRGSDCIDFGVVMLPDDGGLLVLYSKIEVNNNACHTWTNGHRGGWSLRDSRFDIMIRRPRVSGS